MVGKRRKECGKGRRKGRERSWMSGREWKDGDDDDDDDDDERRKKRRRNERTSGKI